jgi:hypothetical protein
MRPRSIDGPTTIYLQGGQLMRSGRMRFSRDDMHLAQGDELTPPADT